MRKLSVADTVVEVYCFFIREFATVVRLSLFPLLLAVGIEYVDLNELGIAHQIMISATFASEEKVGSNWVLGRELIGTFSAIVGIAIGAVAVHRVILLGDFLPGMWFNLRFGKIEALFALVPAINVVTILVLSLLGVPGHWKSDGGPAVVAMCIASAVIFFLARFALVFPIAVLKGRFDFGQAWVISSGNVWRMLGLWMAVLTLPLALMAAIQSLLVSILKLSPFSILGVARSFDGSLLQALLVSYPSSIVFGALCVATLSYSYKSLVGFAPDAVLKPNA